MAKISNINTTGIGGDGGHGAGGDEGLFAMLACVGVFICMISTLVGIKIWWFKHRLTFDHGRTSNGAAGGATPTLPLRTRSSREKRMSQEIREPVEVHGVFRRRQEDDLDIVPTKQLPPVRIRTLSQSTPSLFPLPPTRRQERVRSAIFEEYEPPTREPPRPPIDSLSPPTREPPRPPIDSSPPLHTPTISLVEEMPTFDELEQKYRQMELNETKAHEVNAEPTDESILRVRESPPQPPKRFNRNSSKETSFASAVGMHKFVKAKSPTTDTEVTQQKLSERRATGYLRPDEADIKMAFAEESSMARSHSVEEFGERRPTGYIKYEEIDTDGLEDFRNKWDALQTSLGPESPISYQSCERAAFETLHGHNYDHLNRASACELRTMANGAPATFTDVGRGANTAGRFSWQPDERSAGKQVRPQSQASIDFTSDEEFAEELDGFKPQTILKSATVADCTFGGYESVEHVRPQTPEVAYAPTRVVKFTNSEFGENETLLSHNLEEEKNTLKMRRPTGYVRTVQPDELWDEMEANIKQDEREKHLWLEIEKDVNLNRDFASNIEEEFDKIRHSYQENEAAFLENNSSLKRVPKQVVITPEPEGFGKSIDEDWESFENLSDDKTKSNEVTGKQIVQFKLSDLEDAYEKESVLRTERRPTAFVRNTEQLQRELSNIEDEDEGAVTSTHYEPSSVEFVDEANENSARSLKERRPTGYVRPQISDLDEDYVHEHNRDSIFEPVEEPLTIKTESPVRPRTRQKVTFDFSNTEYFQTPQGDRQAQEAVTNFATTTKHAGSDTDSEDGVEATAHHFPKPMQRITKIHYTAESVKNDSVVTQDEALARTISPAPVPLLFGTQISLEKAETEINDSWAAIRQRRQITTTSTSTSPQQRLTPILINTGDPPKPAFRNPLAQSSSVQSVTLLEERFVTQQQHMSTFQPHAAARHQYFEQSYYNSTEA